MLLWRASGRIEVLSEGRPLVLARQPQRLIAALLVARGNPVDPGNLAERLWDEPNHGSLAALRVTVNRLRRELGPQCPLNTVPTGYQLDVDHRALDLWQFEHSAGEASAATPAQEVRRLEVALNLWEGAPFGEFRDQHWATPVAAHLEELHRTTRERWAARSLDLGRHEQIVSVLEQAVADEPLRERRWLLLMLALYRCGRQADALRVFNRARGHLIEELGIEPGRDLVDLEARILRHDPNLDLRSPDPIVVRTLAPVGALLGRQDEWAQVLSLLSRHRAVALVGLGGIGKTRLAQAIASSLEVEHVLVELAPLTDPDKLANVVAASLGLNDDGRSDELLARSAAELERRRAVVVLDNCEHLGNEVSCFAQTLLQAAPNCRLLLTSRGSVHITGLTTVVLGPLPLGSIEAPGPAALIIADKAGICPTHLAARWSEIERAFDVAGGVPLALELAGRALAGQRGRPGAISTGGSADPVVGAVRAAIDDLPPSLTSDLCRLAELPGGFAIEFAERVLTIDEREVRYRIDGLAQRGLVVADHRSGPLRFAFLEPVRSELRALTAPTDRRVIVRNTATAVGSLATDAIGRWTEPFDHHLVAVLDDEHRNVQAIVGDPLLDTSLFARTVVQLVPCWRSCGRNVEAHVLAARALELVGPDDDELRAELLLSRVLASTSFASRAVHLTDLSEARSIAQRLGDWDLELRVIVELVQAYGWSGEMRQADELLTLLERELPNHPHPWTASSVRRMRALFVAINGQIELGVQQLVVEAIAFEHDFPSYAVSLLFLAANLLRIAGDEAGARSALTRAAAFEVDRFSAGGHAKVALELARVAVATNAPDAEALLRRAAPLLDRFGDTRSGLVCRRDLGRWLLANGDTDEAERLLADVIPPLLSIDRLAAATAVAALASSWRANGRPGSAGLAAAAVRLGVEGSGSPLSAAERADIELAVAFAGADPIDDAELVGLVDSVCRA